MRINARQEDHICKLQFEGELTIYHGLEIKKGLIEHLAANDEIEIHLGSVTEMDTAGCQLLLAAKREGARLGKRVRFISHSQAALELIDLYQIAGQFGDPLVIPAQR